MTTTVEAIYEGGKLILPQPLPLPDKAHVMVTIQIQTVDSDPEHSAWLKLSEQALLDTWSNSGDDIFNELLTK